LEPNLLKTQSQLKVYNIFLDSLITFMSLKSGNWDKGI